MNFSKLLQKNEELVASIKKIPLIYAKSGCLATVILLIPFFFLFLLVKWGILGIIILGVMAVAGFLAILRVIFIYNGNIFFITDRRIIVCHRNGFFDGEVSECDLSKISEVSYRYRGVFQTLFKYGSLKINLLDGDKPIFLNQISRPSNVQQLILELRRERSH